MQYEKCILKYSHSEGKKFSFVGLLQAIPPNCLTLICGQANPLRPRPC